jgi:aspartyl-tRNA synthetase
MYKTNTCGELRASHIGMDVTLAGWVNRRRVLGGINFVDLRDRFGTVQVVTDPAKYPKIHQALEEVRPEWVIQVEGIVRLRPEGLANPNMPTGEVEVLAKKVKIFNQAKTTPITISKEEGENEEIRLRYRYLDLRRERMRGNLILRHKVVKFIRDYLDSKGFLEIETPILFKTTPEGVSACAIGITQVSFMPHNRPNTKELLMSPVWNATPNCTPLHDEDQRDMRRIYSARSEMSFVERGYAADRRNVHQDGATVTSQQTVIDQPMAQDCLPGSDATIWQG